MRAGKRPAEVGKSVQACPCPRSQVMDGVEGHGAASGHGYTPLFGGQLACALSQGRCHSAALQERLALLQREENAPLSFGDQTRPSE